MGVPLEIDVCNIIHYATAHTLLADRCYREITGSGVLLIIVSG